MTDMRHDEERALRDAVESGEGFRDAAETEAASRWALAEIERLRRALHDRDSEIVQEQIGDDARAELKRLQQALSVVRNVAEGALVAIR